LKANEGRRRGKMLVKKGRKVLALQKKCSFCSLAPEGEKKKTGEDRLKT